MTTIEGSNSSWVQPRLRDEIVKVTRSKETLQVRVSVGTVSETYLYPDTLQEAKALELRLKGLTLVEAQAVIDEYLSSGHVPC